MFRASRRLSGSLPCCRAQRNILGSLLDMIHEDVHGLLCGISRASGVAFDTAAEAFVDWRGDEER